VDVDAKIIIDSALTALIAGEVETYLSWLADNVRVLQDRGVNPPLLRLTGKAAYRDRLVALGLATCDRDIWAASFEILRAEGPDGTGVTWVQAVIHLGRTPGSAVAIRIYAPSLTESLLGWLRRRIGRRDDPPELPAERQDQAPHLRSSSSYFAVRDREIKAVMAPGWPLLPWLVPPDTYPPSRPLRPFRTIGG
jgi:hypothetical protein